MHFAKTKYRCEVSPSSPLKSFPKIKVTDEKLCFKTEIGFP